VGRREVPAAPAVNTSSRQKPRRVWDGRAGFTAAASFGLPVIGLNPCTIMILEMDGRELGERLAKPESPPSIRVRLAQIKSKTGVIHTVVSP
jgi:hypothetical protein